MKLKQGLAALVVAAAVAAGITGCSKKTESVNPYTLDYALGVYKHLTVTKKMDDVTTANYYEFSNSPKDVVDITLDIVKGFDTGYKILLESQDGKYLNFAMVVDPTMPAEEINDSILHYTVEPNGKTNVHGIGIFRHRDMVDEYLKLFDKLTSYFRNPTLELMNEADKKAKFETTNGDVYAIFKDGTEIKYEFGKKKPLYTDLQKIQLIKNKKTIAEYTPSKLAAPLFEKAQSQIREQKLKNPNSLMHEVDYIINTLK
jgi:hypothetical protein